MFKYRFLRNIFFVAIVIVMILPTYSTFIAYPSFTTLLIQEREDEAIRTANHLSTILLPKATQSEDTHLVISTRFTWEVSQVLKDFKLMKIKVFSQSGNIVYSTDPNDIGEINTKSYFHNLVATGKTFTKIVKKGNFSMEGQKVTLDVVETYVPIMHSGQFKGAFEIYYDITMRKNNLDNLLFYSSLLLFSSAFGLLGIIILIINKIGKTLDELHHAKEIAEAATHAKSNFIAYISHEIRNPINGLLGILSMVLDTTLTPKQREELQIAHRTGEMLLSLLNNVLDFSKIEVGKLELEKIDFDLHTTIQESTQLLKAQAQTKGLQLALQLDPNLPPWVNGDPTRLRQILINLISNAVKFTERGTITVTVKYLEGETLPCYFEVQDTGIGMSVEAQDRIFQPFTQAHNSTTRQYGGTGLGLSLVKQFVELMQGEIGIRTQPNQGSTFWFRIPLPTVKASQNTIPPLDNHQPLNKFLKPYQALLVEDSPINQQIALFMLKKLGLQVEVANNGQEALEAITKHHYDIIFMDCQMPVMDGYTATAEIRCRERENEHVPIIAMTGSILEQEQQQFRQAGVDDFLMKPIKLEDLTNTIQHWLTSDQKDQR